MYNARKSAGEKKKKKKRKAEREPVRDLLRKHEENNRVGIRLRSLFHAEVGHIFHLSEGLHFPCNGILEKQQMTLLEEAAVSLRVCTRAHTNTHSHTQF